jgi:quinol monooxygenase YgiN
MQILVYLLLNMGMLPTTVLTQIPVQPPIDSAVYAISYVEAIPLSRTAMVAALKRYRDASLENENGCVRLELFEQLGRRGHFAIVEKWKDQKAFDAHGMTAHVKELQDELQPLRVSDYDQRPYKTFAVASAPATENRQAIHVVAHIDTLPAAQAQGAALLKRLAESSRKEKGNLRFDILRHTMHANHFTVIETWQDQTALDHHAAALHTKLYRDELQPMSGSPFDERLFKTVE